LIRAPPIFSGIPISGRLWKRIFHNPGFHSRNWQTRPDTVISDISIGGQNRIISMQPGIRRGIVTIVIISVLVTMICASGCIQPTNVSQGSQSGQYSTSAPSGQGHAVASGTEPPGGGTAQVTEPSKAVDNGTAENISNGPKYQVGSSVQKDVKDSSYDRDRMWVIVNITNDTYTVGQIYYDPKASVWFKVSEERLVNRVFHAVERDYPVLKGTVDWNSFPAKHGVVDQYGTTRLEW
jgi:hypothetical protein